MKRPKNKILSFRLSEEEYETLKTCCEAQGGRSMSDLARVAVQTLVMNGGGAGEKAIQSRLNALDGRVQVLDLAVGRLTQILEGSKG
jgi:hypothetical protein